MHCGIPHPTLFITRQKTIGVPRYDNGQIFIWQNNATDNPRKTIPAGLSEAWSVYLTGDEQIPRVDLSVWEESIVKDRQLRC